MSESSSPAWIAADVENGHIVYRGCWEGEADTLTPETTEEAPISERLRDILEWAFERTTTVHVRVDWSGEYWLAHAGTVGEIGEGFEGEIYLAPPMG